MKIKSALVTQMSGSVGGITGAHNQGGLYFRARSIPVNTNTVQQQAVRATLATLTSRWNDTLTPLQRDQWANYSSNVPIVDRLGEARPIGGIAQYIRSNVPRLQAGLDRIDTGPTTFNLGSFTPVTFTASLGDTDNLEIVFDADDAWANESDAAMLIYASRPVSPSINFFRGPFRFAGSVDGDDASAPTPPATIDSPFPLLDGQRVYLRVRVTRADGRLSSDQILAADVS